MFFRKRVLTAVWLWAAVGLAAAPAVRLKDIATLRGMRENQLLGVGLVTGLAGKGDSSGSSLLQNALASLVANFGFEVKPQEIKSKNCAVVVVSAEVPSFLRSGDRVDVRVSSIGDARGVEGGLLLQTPLRAANGKVYAVAQGQVLITGTAPGPGAAATGGGTVGWIPKGAIAEQEILSSFVADQVVSLILRNPDFVTANTVSQAVSKAFPEAAVSPVDAALIEIKIPENRKGNPVGFVAELESLEVTPEAAGKVVIDSRSGAIVFGEKVRIGKVAVSYRNVQVRVGAAFEPSGEQPKEHFVIEDTTTVEALVKTLTTVGLKMDAVIGIIQAIEKAGALFGTLVIM